MRKVKRQGKKRETERKGGMGKRTGDDLLVGGELPMGRAGRASGAWTQYTKQPRSVLFSSRSPLLDKD